MERKQRIRKFSQVLLILGLAALACWLVWSSVSGFLFHSDIFRIRKIDIEGNHNVTSNEVIALLPFREGDNLFQVGLSEASDNVRQCKPELKNIALCRRWQRVLIKIDERLPLACVTVDGQRMGIDEDNVPFPLRGRLSREPLPEIIGTPDTDRQTIVKFIKMFASESKEMSGRIARLQLEPVDDIVFETNDNLKVYWGQAEKDKIKPKLKRLAQVLADAKTRFAGVEYVNLCFFDDGRIIIKPLGAPVPVKTTASMSNTGVGQVAKFGR
jgi:cell division protein FtsQ